jgi:hypothetical protein
MKHLILSLITALPVLLSSQSTLILQPDAAAGKDASIFNLNALANFGDDVNFIASQWDYSGEPGTTRSLIEFDLSSLPKGAFVNDARLSLYYNGESQTPGQVGDNAAYLRRLIEPWEENTVAWNMQPFYTTDNEVLIPASSFPDQDYMDIDVTALVRDMATFPNTSHGFIFMLQSEVGVGNSMKFYSSDASAEFERPMLTVTYSTTSTFDPGAIEVKSEPNPFSDFFLFRNIGSSYDLAMTDCQGQTIFSKTGEVTDNTIYVDQLDNIPPGIYFVTVKSENNIYFSRIIKH